ncbi:hypothetical protein DRE_02616 [Drechslerella stenobrocha 248]|uniref:PWWP domain-containing protein n=1 Tax=Drechslerella stenobrocha 248 TaxID=1043628 RepID=W7I7F5_9PEZI|nr:hypothetical protein DRE_02616 [Drechslerella stenobrocha 248]
MATIEKAKSPGPLVAAESLSEVKKKTSEVLSTDAPVEKTEVDAPATGTKSGEPSKTTEHASDASAAKPSDDADEPAIKENSSHKPAPHPSGDDGTAQTTELAGSSKNGNASAASPTTEANRPSRAAAQKAQEASKARTPARRKSTTNLPGATPTGPANKRKSLGGKASAEISFKPGMIVLARLKGYSPWPAIIVEEDMLPPAVLKARPKDSTSKRKGKFSMVGIPDDEIPVAARGSSAGHWPLMFLDNFDSFSWTMFTEITLLDEAAIDAFSPRGKAKDIVKAYENAKKGLTLEEIREMKADALADPEEDEEAEDADAMDVDEPEEEEEEVEAKTPSKGKKKSTAKESASKKRKAEEEATTSKTPKKVNTGKGVKTPASAKTKTPVNGSSKKKSAATEPTPKSASKKRSAAAASEEDEEEEVSEKASKKKAKTAEKKQEKDDSQDDTASFSTKTKNLTAEKDQKEKEVMYLRHKIQKALLTTDKVPTESEVVNIDHYFQKLESYPRLEVAIIKKTKINKVLKALLRLASIPFDDKYKFKDRTLKLLDEWNQLLANDPEGSGAEPNGVKKSGDDKDNLTKSKSPEEEDIKQKPEDPKEKVEISGADAEETAEIEEDKAEKPTTSEEAATAVVEDKEAGKEVATEA